MAMKDLLHCLFHLNSERLPANKIDNNYICSLTNLTNLWPPLQVGGYTPSWMESAYKPLPIPQPPQR
jgi:hypothetical protein